MDDFSISATAAADCAAACQTFIEGVNRIYAQGQNMVNKSAFGTLPSGQALGQKFVDVSTGQPYSLDTVLRQHIEVISRLKAAFEAAGQRSVETDEQNAANLTGS